MHAKFPGLIVFVVVLVLLEGCGGARILDEPVALERAGPLALASNEQLEAVLDWVIVRDGPGTWSRDAYWDEYLLSVTNLSDAKLSIITIEVIDSLEETIPSLPDRRMLEKATRSVSKRYKELGYDIAPGANGGHMAAASAGALVGGTGIVYAGLSGALGGGTLIATAPAFVATGLILASPVLLVGGLVKAVNNDQVAKRIRERRTALPIGVAAGEEINLDVFFPVSPSPQQVRITYETEAGSRQLTLLTAEPMQGLHIKEEPQ